MDEGASGLAKPGRGQVGHGSEAVGGAGLLHPRPESSEGRPRPRQQPERDRPAGLAGHRRLARWVATRPGRLRASPSTSRAPSGWQFLRVLTRSGSKGIRERASANALGRRRVLVVAAARLPSEVPARPLRRTVLRAQSVADELGATICLHDSLVPVPAAGPVCGASHGQNGGDHLGPPAATDRRFARFW
jgi:hypothetical protein